MHNVRFLVLALSFLPSAALAQDITVHTACSAMVAAMDSENPERIRPLHFYILNTMDALDEKHTEQGEPGIMAQLSDEGRVNMVAATSVHCRNYPRISAAFVYRGIREVEMRFGTAK